MQPTMNDRHEYWQQIAAHTFARNSNGTPWAVQRHVAALVGDPGIAKSFVTYSPAEPSGWSVLLVTVDGRLIKLHIEFNAEQYDQEEEQRPFRKSNPVSETVHDAWIRRLSDVVQLDIRRFQIERDNNLDRQPASSTLATCT